jgi:predicted helicase
VPQGSTGFEWMLSRGSTIRASHIADGFISCHVNPKLSGTKNNVFGIQTGVAISFLVRRKDSDGQCRIFYARRPELDTREDKLEFLSGARLSGLDVEEIRPDANANWINQTDNDFGTFIPIASKEAKTAKTSGQVQAIFKLYSLGVVTNRDEWVYQPDIDQLSSRVQSFIHIYESEQARWKKEGRPPQIGDWVSREIKWTSELETYLKRNIRLQFSRERIRLAAYRPFVSLYTYYDRVITHRVYQQDLIFPINRHVENRCLVFTDPTAMKPWLVSAVDRLPDLHYVGAAAGTVCLPSKSFEAGEGVDNITDWALEQFRARYDTGKKPRRPITKDGIFHYVYGVLHDPIYREKYAQNLKRELPRIPFYADFWRWAEWGERLMALHLGYETVKPWRLKRVDVPDEKSENANLPPKPLLKADRDAGVIVLDTETQLTGVPPEAWAYKLGNRSALEWILDQYKEKTPKDPTIRAKFNTYRFADHKEKVIDLLMRVVRVSVETMEIVDAMKSAQR